MSFGILATTLPPVILTVAAASDISPAGSDLAAGFHSAYPTASVRFAFGSSGALAQQIANGAPYDLFLSANEAFVDQLTAARRIAPDSVFVYADGQLGLLWRDGKPHEIKDLAASWVRFVALANPRLAPYGAAARQSLEHASLWPAVQAKLVYGENVRQALQLFDSGNADAVLTSYSLVNGRPGASVVPAAWHTPMRQKAGIVAASPNRDAARQFLAFLASPAGRKILSAHGLKVN